MVLWTGLRWAAESRGRRRAIACTRWHIVLRLISVLHRFESYKAVREAERRAIDEAVQSAQKTAGFDGRGCPKVRYVQTSKSLKITVRRTQDVAQSSSMLHSHRHWQVRLRWIGENEPQLKEPQDPDGFTWKTAVIKSKENPSFNETFDLGICRTDVVEVSVWDNVAGGHTKKDAVRHAVGKDNKILGCHFVELGQFHRGTSETQQYPLEQAPYQTELCKGGSVELQIDLTINEHEVSEDVELKVVREAEQVLARRLEEELDEHAKAQTSADEQLSLLKESLMRTQGKEEAAQQQAQETRRLVLERQHSLNTAAQRDDASPAENAVLRERLEAREKTAAEAQLALEAELEKERDGREALEAELEAAQAAQQQDAVKQEAAVAAAEAKVANRVKELERRWRC